MKFYQIQDTAIRLDTIIMATLHTSTTEHTRTNKVPCEWSDSGYRVVKEKYTVTHNALIILTKANRYQFDLPEDDKAGAKKLYNELMALLEGDE